MELALSLEHNSVGHIAKAKLNKYNKHFNLEQLYMISKVLDIKLSELVDKNENINPKTNSTNL